jgi:regulator of protease activity HflC (stomatin/prohibitin superfamily)
VAIGKVEDKISDLEDDRAELMAHSVEARTILQRKYRAALEALDAEIVAKGDKIHAGLAAAAEELVAATKAYDQTVSAAYEKLGVGVCAEA